MNDFLSFTAGRKVKAPREQFKEISREPPAFALMTDDELIESVGKEFIFDVETYTNYFLVSFMCVETQKVVFFERCHDGSFIVDKFDWILNGVKLVGFNSAVYDVPMAFAGRWIRNTETLKQISDAIIKGGLRPWQVMRDWQIPKFNINHVDLYNVAPLDESLKKYAARMHAKRLQDLPYPPDAVLTYEQAMKVREYNIGADLPNTRMLRLELKDQLEMRERIGAQVGEDVRSKSDAQIAEVIIRSEIKKATGREPVPAEIDPGWTFQYKIPSYISYEHPQLKTMLETLRHAWFEVNGGGYPKCPQVQEINITIGTAQYQMGLGGLHSQEKNVAHLATDEIVIEDFDVASYYPKLILNAGMYPRGCGPVFIEVFQSIVDRRLAGKERMTAAQKAGQKPNPHDETESNSLKITANGTFGKLASMFSAMYSPDLMAQVTLTGQLCLLLFVVMMESEGITAISGNTDGVILKYRKSRAGDVKRIVSLWEQRVSLQMEVTKYKAIYQRDVNNYIAIKTNGEVKLKGIYAEKGSTGNSRLSKNPECLIVSDALVAYLTKGVPLNDTIRQCKDFTRFVAVRLVKNGAQKDGVYLGKTIRWYYAKNQKGYISSADSGNKVPKSEGAKPCMDLPDEWPTDIDLDRYFAEALESLVDIGALQRPGSLF